MTTRYPGLESIINAGGKAATLQENAERIVEKSQGFQEAQEALQAADIIPQPPDDPPAPTVTDVLPKRRAVSLEWDVPDPALGVIETVIRITRVSNGSLSIFRVRAQDGGTWINDLLVEDYTVEFQYKDKWDRLSDWTTPATFTPLPTITDQISADLEVAAGQIVPYLPEDPSTSSDFSTPALFAEGLFDLTKMAATQRLNVLPFGKSIWTGYKLASETTLKGTTFTANSSSNNTYSFVNDDAGARLIQQVLTATGTTASLIPWPFFLLPPESQYVFAVRVRNAGPNPAPVRVVVDLSTDGSTVASTITGTTTTIPNDNVERTLFVTFARGANTYMRWRYQLVTPASACTVKWNKNQLVPADGRDLATITEAPVFSIPVLGVDGLNAQILAAWDLTAARAIIGDATIETAKIVDLAVEKLTAGFLDVQMDIVAGGEIVWDGGALNDLGVELTDVAEGTADPPNSSRASKITSPATGGTPTPWGALSFFNNNVAGSLRRGASLWADGDSGTSRIGLVKVVATNGNQDPANANSATVVLRSSETGAAGQVEIFPKLLVTGPTTLNGDVTVLGSTHDLTVGRNIIASNNMDVREQLNYNGGDGIKIAPTYRESVALAAGDAGTLSNGRMTMQGVWTLFRLDPSNSTFFPTWVDFDRVGDTGAPRLVNGGTATRTYRLRAYAT